MTVPNDGDPAYLDTAFQSRLFQADLDILEAAIGGVNGVVSGLGVTQSAVPAMSVLVASGSAVFDSVTTAVTGGTVLVSNSDPTDPRFDLIVALDNGTVDIITGTADPAPELPSPGAGFIGIAGLYVPAGDTAITTNQLVDKRVFVTPPLGTSQWNTITATTNLARTNTATLAVDSVLKFTMAGSTKYRIRGMFIFKVSAAGNVQFGVGGPASPTLLQGSIQAHRMQPGFILGGAITSYGFDAYDTTTGVNIAINGTNWFSVVNFDAIVHNGSNTSPDFGIWWSQQIASAGVTQTRLAGSWLEYEVV